VTAQELIAQIMDALLEGASKIITRRPGSSEFDVHLQDGKVFRVTVRELGDDDYPYLDIDWENSRETDPDAEGDAQPDQGGRR
jgi:hypothetical protein